MELLALNLLAQNPDLIREALIYSIAFAGVAVSLAVLAVLVMGEG